MTDQDDGKWHLDRRVPIALITTIALQTAAAIWWAASTSERVSNLEKRVDATTPQADRLTRVEVKIESVQSDISEMKLDVKRLLGRNPQ